MINICFFVKNKFTILIFFSKSKPFLKDLIPSDYVDIHSHLLPGIDDGSKSIEDTKSLINSLKDIGFNRFITTPHIMEGVWENNRSIIIENAAKTNRQLIEEQIELKAAAEYMLDGNFLKILSSEKLLTLKDHYVLVEMSYLNPPMNLFDIIFEIQLEGYTPILAHPERYNFYHSSLSDYTKLKTAGCKFQINMLSTVGYYGPHVAKASDYLITNNLIDFIGSDVHHNKHIEFMKNKIVLKKHESLNSIFQNNSVFRF